MVKKLISIISIIFSSAIVYAEDVPVPPEINQDTPVPSEKATLRAGEAEVITIYESSVLPGLRKCTEQEVRDKSYSPIACQNDKEALSISTREQKHISQSYIIEDDTVPQGNLFKLKFDRFKRRKRN